MIETFKQPKTYAYMAVFILVLLSSLIAHLPAALITNHERVQSQLDTTDISISSVSGSIWSGSVSLSVEGINIGDVTWQVKPSSFFAMQTDVDLQWRYQGSNVKAHITTGLLQQKELYVDGVTGELALGQLVGLAKRFDPQIPAMITNLQGQMKLEQFSTVLEAKKQWPKDLKGSAKLVGVSFMKNNLPVTNIKLSQNAGKDNAKLPINIALIGEEKKWNLQGDLKLTHKQRYSGEISVKAVDENSLPDWVFMMRQKSPTHFTAKLNGSL